MPKKIKTVNKPVPEWALRKSRKVCSSIGRFHIGDIVDADPSRSVEADYLSIDSKGVGVITGISENGRCPEYSVDFGPKVGEVSWYPDDSLVLLRAAFSNI